MRKIKIKIPRTIRIFTILREIVRQVVNFINELIDEVNKLKKELDALKKLTGKSEVPKKEGNK